MLSQIRSGIDQDSAYLVDKLEFSSIDGSLINTIEEGDTWMTLIIKYMKSGELLPDKSKVVH